MKAQQLKGYIFNIKRFSTHDGIGIRTTVFLKGCPLGCVWCHNPEGISQTQRMLCTSNRCILCGNCVTMAQDQGVYFESGKITIDPSKDERWEDMVHACPSAALQMDSREITVSELMSELMKDLVFYKYGGGVTLSGGEPLLQSEFAIELLKELKRNHIHTCMETSLHADLVNVKKVLPYLDSIFADLKIMDDEAHKKYTGGTNNRIKNNIMYLLRSEKKRDVVIRTPIIPNITSGTDNIAAISRYISDIFPEVKYEILNYNPLAMGKYKMLDKKYCYSENPDMYAKEEMNAYGEIAKENGVINVILES